VLAALGITERLPSSAPILTPEEQVVWDALSEPRDRDTLITMLDIPVHELQTTLTLMEINGHIAEHEGLLRRT
jgi:predicted Rossmann fold nucleotide-binding protein DprA/Smf involved in DNA uptake